MHFFKDKTHMHCFRRSFYFFSHKELVFLIEKQFSFIFSKLKNTKKDYLFVNGTTKNVPKAM
jgi:hypothetical protein